MSVISKKIELKHFDDECLTLDYLQELSKHSILADSQHHKNFKNIRTKLLLIVQLTFYKEYDETMVKLINEIAKELTDIRI
jgi:hypothetical protein